MQVTLVRLGENKHACEVSLDRFPIRIGRDPQLDVSLTEHGVSEFHCQLGQINGILFVRDLGSAHGTFVNGFHVARSDLLPGDQLTVGEVTFQVFYPRERSARYFDMEREMTLAPIDPRRTDNRGCQRVPTLARRSFVDIPLANNNGEWLFRGSAGDG